MKTRLARRRTFRCPRPYAADAWSAERSAATLGACFSPEGLGHEYGIEVVLEGEVDPESGMILNIVDVDRTIGETLRPIEGRRLDESPSPLAGRAATTEVLANHLFEGLVRAFATWPVRLIKLRLNESADLWVDVWA